MRILVVIPARGGSKGLPRKNVLPCAGHPLLSWSIFAARAAKASCHIPSEWTIVVSTDNAEIADVASRYGAGVLVRPSDLATDTATTDAALVHAVEEISGSHPRFDLVVTLQPTVPVRRPGLIDACICRLVQKNADSLLTAYPLHFVWWNETPGYKYDADRTGSGRALSPAWRTQCPRRPMRQQMEGREMMYAEDGSVFVTRVDFLLGTGQRVGGHLEVYETERTIDIDTAEDLAVAQALLLHREGK